MKKFVVGLMLVLSLASCGKKNEAPKENEKQAIKIGITVPLTGPMGFAGENMKKSLAMAMEGIDQERLKYKYELIIEDNSFDNRKTVTNLNKFLHMDNVNAVMSFFGSSGTITSQFAEKNKIVHMSCAWSNEVAKGFYNFNHDTKPMTTIKKVIEYFHQKKYKKIAFIYHSILEVEELMKWFVPLLQQEGFEIVADIPYIEPARDFKMEIEKIKAANPDVVYIQSVPPELTIFAKQRKEGNLNIPVVGFNIFGFAPEGWENEVYATESTGKHDFEEKFTQYSGLNPMPCTGNFYDGLRMLIQAFENVGDGKTVPSSEEIVKEIYKFNSDNFTSVFDRFEIDEEGNIDIPTVMKVIKNGKPVLLNE